MEVLDMVQGSREWLEARCGLVTASEMRSVFRGKGEGKMRRSYLLKLAAEKITREPSEVFDNADMARGRREEPEAREAYEYLTGVECEQVGFIRDLELAGGVGYSPDGLLGDDGLLEIKSKARHLQVAALLLGEPLPEHWDQLQAGLWISRREWIDLVCYCPVLPLCKHRITRDEDHIKRMACEVSAFNEELASIVEQINSRGA